MICYSLDAKHAVKDFLKFHVLRRKKPQPWPCRVPIRKIKNIVLEEGLALNEKRELSWFYHCAFDRNDSDPLTNFALDFVRTKISRDAKILVTGCGTGITVFRMADDGYSDITGIDLLEKCIAVAQKVKKLGRYDETFFKQCDGFRPDLDGSYDLITAMHWVFSAWMGNYGNSPIHSPKSPEVRERLLTEFFATYSPLLKSGGYLILELVDAVADYRIKSDHPEVDPDFLDQIYPVRHTPEQVEKCASANGLAVRKKNLCVKYSHQPRTSYLLQKL